MYNILKTCNNEYLNVETKLQVFDTYVSSVLNYGCEVWGFNMAKDVEKIHTDFCKRILKVRNCTPHFMLYAELGRFPLLISRKIRIVKYWIKLLNTENIILKSLYEDMLENIDCRNWLSQVRDLLFSLGFGYVWYNQCVPNRKLFLAQLNTVLNDFFIQEMNSYFENSNKCYLYRYLTDTHMIQYYIRKSLPDKYLFSLTQFRLSSHELMIEKGRYQNIPRGGRLCQKCSLHEVEDEFHFIFVCPCYRDLRVKYLNRYYYTRPSMFKLVNLLSVKNKTKLCNLARFLISAFARRKENL